jgi:hypothetical protein
MYKGFFKKWNLFLKNFELSRESFDTNRENARVFCSPGFYLRNNTSVRKKEKMAMVRIKVCMKIVRDSSAVRQLFVRLAGAVEHQSALHKENSGFATPTLGRHISTFLQNTFYIMYVVGYVCK